MLETMKLSRILLQRATKYPQTPFITDLDRKITLNNAQVASAVSETLDNWGSPGQSILAFMQGGTPDALVWLAALAGGHTLIPLSPETPSTDIETLIRTERPTLIIGQPASHTWQSSARSQSSESLLEILSTPLDKWSTLAAAPDNGQVLLQTSGSTGRPKQLVLSARQLLTSGHQIAEAHQLTADDRGLTVLPLFHINAPVVSLLAALVSGSEVLLAKKYSSSRFWQWVEQYQPTWISLVPAVAVMLLQIEQPDRNITQGIRFVRSASAPLAQTTLQAFEKRFGLPLIETYGISEAAATIASNPLPPADHKAGSVGLPVHGIAMRICAPDSITPVAQGVTGEVCIKGLAVIRRYRQNRGADSFQDGWFRTGDLGYFDQDGYLFLIGRSKDIIIRGGENIFPIQIESAILGYPAMQEAAVVGKPDPVYGEIVVAFVGTSKPTASQEQLRLYLEKQLPPVQRPAEIRFLDALPKMTSNKIDKVALREMARSGTYND
jgi:acyl-CoA synthetase (AMP-forming)/AMP-acid ligase II